MKRNDNKKFPDILSRFRNDVIEFSEKFGGVTSKKSNFKAPLTRKEKRKLERKLKHAKKLAYSKKEKAPTLEAFIESSKKTKNKTPQIKNSQDNNETELDKPKEKAKNLNSIEMIENRMKKEVKEKIRYEDSSKGSNKKKLIEDNKQEEKEIAKLEKLLHIKKDSKKYKQAFYDEGFADLLDFCDEGKRKEMFKEEANLWLDTDNYDKKLEEESKKKKDKIEKLNKELSNDESTENSDQSEYNESGESDLEEENQDDFFIKQPSKKKVKFDKQNEAEEFDDEIENENENEDEELENEEYNNESMEEEFENDDENENEDEELENEENDLSNEEENEEDEEDFKEELEMKKKGLKEDIYGRLVDKKGNVVKAEKYVPPAQRLQQLLEQSSNVENSKLAKLSKQLNGLLNRLSTSNIVSILNQISQMFYSNQFTRFDLMQTLYNLIENSLIKQTCMTPIRLLIEHAALISALTSGIGVELGANLLQKLCQKLNTYLNNDSFFLIENKALDNLILFLCNLYSFKLFSSNLIIDLLNEHLIQCLNINDLIKIEKNADLILLILRSVGFSLRKDNPISLKDLIIKIQTNINTLLKNIDSNKSSDTESINNRLKFMLESLNAIKNNDIRKLDAFDQTPIDLIKKQMKNCFKEDQTLLNISYNDLLNANELGRWWIVGSAWNLKENENNTKEKSTELNNSKSDEDQIRSNEGIFSEKILKLAKEQRMNTDIRRAIFCIIVSAEDYTDAFMKLVKLSLKKQQEREIIYIILHCALNEKKPNPYYFYLMQKFCEYDRRFKMTLQFHTWDKFKLLTTMSQQQISNFAALYSHLIGTGAMSLNILKNADFGDMNVSMLQFLRELLIGIFNHDLEKMQEIFLKISSIKKLYQLRNAIKLFIYHFILTDKGKNIVIDDSLKEKCHLAEKILSINTNN